MAPYLGLVISFIAVAGFVVVECLQCYKCNVRYEKRLCLDNFTLIQPNYRNCSPQEQYCMVEKFEINGNLQKFVRDCASKCEPECKGYEGTGVCITCCQDDLCNVGNHAVVASPLNVVAMATVLFVWAGWL